jgi:hypothetical protein
MALKALIFAALLVNVGAVSTPRAVDVRFIQFFLAYASLNPSYA